MRVVVVSEFALPYVGGIEVLADKLLPALVRKGHAVQVVTSHGPMDLPDEETFDGVVVRRFPFRAVLEGKDIDGILLLRQRLNRLLREFDPQLIHLNGIAASQFMLLPFLSSRQAGVLLQLHQSLFAWEAGESLLVKLLHRADWVVSVSASALAQARELVPGIESRSSVIRNTVRPPDFIPSPLPFAPPRLLCLGRLKEQKGFDLALRAFAALDGRFNEVTLIIAGDGEERPSLEALAKELGIADRCEWRGWVHPDHTFRIIDEATLLLLPSRFEGLPLVAIEAAWMARPIVASRIDGNREAIVHDETGLLVAPEDVAAITESITRLLTRPEDTCRMGAAARARVAREFGWEECVDAYDVLYRRIGGANTSGPIAP